MFKGSGDAITVTSKHQDTRILQATIINVSLNIVLIADHE
jgi:hypothetical protein